MEVVSFLVFHQGAGPTSVIMLHVMQFITFSLAIAFGRPFTLIDRTLASTFTTMSTKEKRASCFYDLILLRADANKKWPKVLALNPKKSPIIKCWLQTFSRRRHAAAPEPGAAVTSNVCPSYGSFFHATSYIAARSQTVKKALMQ